MNTGKRSMRQILLGVLLAVFAVSIAAICFLQLKSVGASAAGEETETSSGVKVGMTLNADLVVNFYTPEDAGTATIAFRGEEYEVQGVQTEEGYKYAFDKVTPEYMTEEISFIAGGGYTQTASVREYCEKLLTEGTDGDTLENKVLRELAVDILNYGAAAQTYTDTNADALANAGIGEYQAYATAYDDDLAADVAVDNSGAVKWYSAGLVCGSKPSLYVRVVLPEGQTADGYTLEVNGTEAVWNRTEGQIVTYYYTELNVLQFAEDMSLVVRQGENAVSSTLTYSVHDYIANTADSQVAGSADLVKAMYGLGKAASAYANLGNFGYTADTDNNTLAETYENEAYSWVYPVALQGVSVADGTVTLDNVVTDKALTVIGANGTLALVGENSVRSLQTGAKLTVDGEGSLTLTADGAETAINATGELQIENGTLTADAGVNIDTLRMKGGAVDLTNIAATYNIRNFELADGTFTAKDTLRTDKLVVKGGTLDIDVTTESGDDPSGITPYSDAEGQRYYFLGGNVTLSRTGNSGSGGLFSWGTGGGVAVVVAGQTRIDVDGFDWAVVFGEVGGTFYEFTQNNPEYGLFNTTPNRVSLAGDSSVNDRIWGTEYWTETVGATVTTTSTANNESELCGHPLEFTHDVDFDNL